MDFNGLTLLSVKRLPLAYHRDIKHSKIKRFQIQFLNEKCSNSIIKHLVLTCTFGGIHPRLSPSPFIRSRRLRGRTPFLPWPWLPTSSVGLHFACATCEAVWAEVGPRSVAAWQNQQGVLWASCPLYATIFHAATKKVIAERLRNLQFLSCFWSLWRLGRLRRN